MITLSDLPIELMDHAFAPPVYSSGGAAGADLYAAVPEPSDDPDNIDAPRPLFPGERRLIPTGIKMAIPLGHHVKIVPRSGLALKHGVTVLNAPGIIDSDYRGEIGVVLINLGDKPFVVKRGERIAQMILERHVVAEFKATFVENDTERGAGGFGSTGR